MSVATQVLPIAPVLNGISGSCRTIFIDSPPEAHHTLSASAIVILRFSRYRRLLFCFPDTSSKLLFCLSLSVFLPVCYLLDRFSACLSLRLYVLCFFICPLFCLPVSLLVCSLLLCFFICPFFCSPISLLVCSLLFCLSVFLLTYFFACFFACLFSARLFLYCSAFSSP